MNKILKDAISLAQQIETKYNQLDGDNDGFFNLYHDDLRTQMNCAWEEVAEIEEDLKTKSKECKKISKQYIEISMQNLKDTLTYVSFIIDVQNKLNNCPQSIYG
jgi:hypothetical protein